MAVVEIHIKNNEVQKIEGQDAYVHVHDHDIKKTTTMIFKKQEELYGKNRNNNKSIGSRGNEDRLGNR